MTTSAAGGEKGQGGRRTAILALQTQGDFLGDLGLLVENGLGLRAACKNKPKIVQNWGRGRAASGEARRHVARTYLTTETGLLSVITTLTLGEEGGLASLQRCIRKSSNAVRGLGWRGNEADSRVPTRLRTHLVLRHTPLLVGFALLVPAIALEFFGKVDHSSVGELLRECENRTRKRKRSGAGQQYGAHAHAHLYNLNRCGSCRYLKPQARALAATATPNSCSRLLLQPQLQLLPLLVGGASAA